MKERDLSALLKSELNRRLNDNPSYSLRSFARSLKMDPSTLSKVLNGRRKLGPRAKETLMSKFGVESGGAREYFDQINDEDFNQIPEWYDTAILEQITVTGFKATRSSLAKVFDLELIQIDSALERLKALNLIRISSSGLVKDATSGQTTNIDPPTTTVAKRNLQKQFLKKAIQSIDLDPLDERDMTTITCAIDVEKIGEAKARIKAFRREMADFLTSGRKSNRTYNMTIAFYPVTKNLKNKKE